MKAITDESEYIAILSRINELVEIVDDDTPKISTEYVELDKLADLVVAYENEKYNI